MAVTTTKTNKPINPRGNDQSPKGYNRAALYSGKALDFDGVNDEITPSGSYFVDPQSGTWTFCAYIYAENSGVVFSRDNQYVELRLNAGKLVARVYAGGWQILTLSNVDLLNEWNFVCWKYDVDNSTFTGYVNGVEQLTETLAPDSVLNFDRIASTGGSNFFDGKIGGVKIYDVGLTPAQVSDLYNNPEKIVPTGVSNDALKLWLPMMEGAGTTAYDGSGNGNHGTISGATYVHGVGAPVSQTAVIDWNKGTNILQQSNAFSTSPWLSFVTLTSGQAGHDGTNNAWKIEKDASSEYLYQNTTITGAGVFSVYAKAGSLNWIRLLVNGSSNGFYYFDLENGVVGSGSAAIAGYIDDVGNGWYRCSFSFNLGTVSRVRIYPADGDNDISGTSGNIYIQDAQAINGSSVGPYIPTLSTAQTTPVLLPQGLTSGRDITGVNLFENVRKQGALNLDGNSWAEVHDNASLDVSDEVTLECWLYHTDTTMLEHIIGKRASSGSWVRIYSATTNTLRVERDGGAATSNVSITENAWSHIVATIDTSDVVRFYVNGTQQTSKLNFTPWGLDNVAPVSIGAWVNENGVPSSNSYASGSIAQPRIYNRALTAEEVLQNYNSGKSIYQ